MNIRNTKEIDFEGNFYEGFEPNGWYDEEGNWAEYDPYSDKSFEEQQAELEEEGYKGLDPVEETISTDDYVVMAASKGYDGAILRNVLSTGNNFIPLSPSQIKSADPVTYDNNGNVIPLSERFNDNNDDIRFRDTADNDYSARDAFGCWIRIIQPTKNIFRTKNTVFLRINLQQCSAVIFNILFVIHSTSFVI